MDYQVLLYYSYTKIEEPKEFAKNHLVFCKSLDLKGRTSVVKEGISGTVSGTVENMIAYTEAMKADPRLADTMFKIDPSEGHTFRKMFVRYRPELVSLRLEEGIDPSQVTGAYLLPQEFKEAILDEQAVVIDARNDYEYDLGYSRGAVRPGTRSFRELPDQIRRHKEEFTEKRTVTYCTGGIRCEKLSGWLVREGFKDAGQLHGGIATYGKDPEVQGELRDGKMYVFDERIVANINQVDKQAVGRDWLDGTPCERYTNCSNSECNCQILASIENEEKHLGACSVEYTKHSRNRYVQDHGIPLEEAELRFAALNEQKTVVLIVNHFQYVLCYR